MKKLCRTLKCTKYKVQSTTFKKLQDSIFVIHHSLFFLLLPLLLLPTVLSAQAPNWLWAKSAIDYDADEELCVTTDAAGNILTTGYFAGQSIIFGSTTLNNANPFLNTEDVFIVKYAPNGNLLWAKSAGGDSDDGGNSVTTDTAGNIIVVGYFSSHSIIFGSDTLTNDSVGFSDIFIVKYDSSGNPLWAKNAGGKNYDYANSVTTDASGNIIVAGEFRSPFIVFGSDTLYNADTAATGDMFIVKYSANGNILWAKKAGSAGVYGDYANSVTTDTSGNILVAGDFSDSIIFGSSTFYNTGSSYTQMFIAKYTASGNVLWAKSANGAEDASCVATDDVGNILVTGSFSVDTVTFGSYTLANAGWENMFVVKYDTAGNVLWAKSTISGSNYDACRATSVSADASGFISVAGYFGSAKIIFGADTLSNFSGSVGYEDIFVVKYYPNGNVLWAKSAGGDDYDQTASITTDASGSILVAGYFMSSSISFSSTAFTNTGYKDIFIAKFSNCSFPAPDICLVTVDSTSTKNLIVWEKLLTANIDSFRVYRDIIGTYTFIGSVSYNDLSKFVDTTNGINPQATSYKYKISVLDICGIESPLSDFHKTIHLQVNSGVNLTWDNYVGFTSAFYYRILRDTIGNGIFSVIDSVTNSNFTYTDINPPVGLNASYVIEIVHPSGGCTATKSSESHNTSRSNVKLGIAQPGGVDEIKNENLAFSIEPNPNNGEFVLRIMNNEQRIKNYEVKIFNILGVEIYRILNTDYRLPTTISLKQPTGIYNVQLRTGKEIFNRKMIVN